MEKLSDLDGEWEVVEAMNELWTWLAAVNCEGEIYANRGRYKTSNGNNITLKFVEKCNPVEKKWRFINSMNIVREFHAICVLRGKIFVVGDTSCDKKFVKTIECYSRLTNKYALVGKTENEVFFHSLIAI